MFRLEINFDSVILSILIALALLGTGYDLFKIIKTYYRENLAKNNQVKSGDQGGLTSEDLLGKVNQPDQIEKSVFCNEFIFIFQKNFKICFLLY
jgi:hypothetical protein